MSASEETKAAMAIAAKYHASPEALIAAMGSVTLSQTPPSHTHTLTWRELPSHTSTVFIVHDEANNWQAVNFPNKPRGFEGQSAKNFDGIEPHDLAVAEMREAGQAFVNAARGAEMTNAISALHRSHRSDGRPHHFLPEAK